MSLSSYIGDGILRPLFRLAAFGYGSPPDRLSIAPRLGSLEHAVDIFQGKIPYHYPYLRGGHDATTELENRCLEIEGGQGAIAVASGQAANSLVLDGLLQGGGRILVSKLIFGGTIPMIELKARIYGAELIYVNPADAGEIKRLATPGTKAIFVESLSNPGGIVAPVADIAAVADKCGAALVVDNTLGISLSCPLAEGAHIVTSSLTKYANGHNSEIGGVIVVGKNALLLEQDKATPSKFLFFSGALPRATPSQAATLAAEIVARLRKLAVLYGTTSSIHSARTILRHLGTISKRLKTQQANAKIIAGFLAGAGEVTNVHFPGNGSDLANDERVRRYFPNGAGSVVTFDLKGGKAAAAAFVDQLNRDGLITHRANLGQKWTMATWPWGTTHIQLTPEEKSAAGITEGTIRLSVGVENPRLLKLALTRAIKAGGLAVPAP